MSAVKRAAWLTQGYHVCPEWCDGGHDTTDSYDDREHIGTISAVTLTADDTWPDEDPGVARLGAAGLPHVNMYLVQHYREAEPRVWLGKGGSNQGVYLTVAEAEVLAAELRYLVEAEIASRRTLPEREARAELEDQP